ncbi:nucleotide-diphospho-sugar transferase [Gorgonomyces haynaldii]|nr:nucleotide-diphospho-sugar transferase [Gorgonomyces haynaldii]
MFKRIPSKRLTQISLIAFVLIAILSFLNVRQLPQTLSQRPASVYRDKNERFSWETKDFTLQDLLRMTTSDRIPQILHQSWKTQDVPERFSVWRDQWKQTNPHLKQILWTDADNDLFVKLFYPQFQYFWSQFPENIYKVDSVRYLYLHQFGGLYVDMDTIPFESVDPLFEGHENEPILGQISSDTNWDNNIPNAFMASKPGHPFWIFVWGNILMRRSVETKVEYVTGPATLFDAVNKWHVDRFPLHLLSPGLIYGEDWRWPNQVCLDAKDNLKLVEECRKLHPDTKVLTVWTHTW